MPVQRFWIYPCYPPRHSAVLCTKTFCTFVRELSSLGLQEDRARNRCGRRQRAGDGRNRIFGPDEVLRRHSSTAGPLGCRGAFVVGEFL